MILSVGMGLKPSLAPCLHQRSRLFSALILQWSLIISKRRTIGERILNWVMEIKNTKGRVPLPINSSEVAMFDNGNFVHQWKSSAFVEEKLTSLNDIFDPISLTEFDFVNISTALYGVMIIPSTTSITYFGTRQNICSWNLKIRVWI